ncbi:MAG: hypothetical protein JWN96_1420 [Mycobacterium sp.]|nr:hypothetical protein [Mycobacterium sp.]
MGKRLTAALAAVAISALGACASARPTVVPDAEKQSTPTSAPASGDSFFAVIPANGGVIAQVSAESGAVLHRVASATRGGRPVTGLARLSPDTLLVTYSTGPACSSNLAGCGPRPNTCGAEVDALNVQTGAIKVLWRVGRDQRLTNAQPSPDGTIIAALASPCVPSYFNDHLVVRRLRDGVTWNIGDQVPRCHVLGAPQWTADSAHLLVSFAPPTGTRPYTGPDGTCTSTGDRSIVKLAATHHQPLITGVTTGAPAGCTYEALASDAVASFTVEACGSDPDFRMQGPVTLVRFDQALHVAQQWPIGRCTNGSNSLAADPAKGVLLAVYLFCNDDLGPQDLGNPVTALERVDGTELRPVTTVSGGGTPFAFITW